MKKLFVILISTFLVVGIFTSCTTTATLEKVNIAAEFGEGFSFLEGRVYKIFASGSAFNSKEEVRDKALFEAGKITYTNGFTYFTILNDSIEAYITGYTPITSDTDFSSSFGKTIARTTTSGGDAIIKSSGDLVIFMFSSPDELLDIGGENLRYFKATTFYDPEEEKAKKLLEEEKERRANIPKVYKNKISAGNQFETFGGVGLKISYEYITDFNMSFGLKFTGVNNAFGVEKVSYSTKYGSKEMVTPFEDFFTIGPSFRYWFIRPQSDKHFFINLGSTCSLAVREYKVNTLDWKEHSYSYGFNGSAELGLGWNFTHFYIDLVALGNFNTFNVHSFGMGTGMGIYF